ncbi:Hypothetical predicted protein [Paramuricea clavata]|uniref:Uncharacterized protein n=1 Tax=Paramuricea clavata TaxID=317549 RepID=A0A7D9J4E4_PARCT|nr:Hypothetical predicted protein [Paramuricea clavata]
MIASQINWNALDFVQKRVGSQLRRLKNTKKGVKLSDGKGFGGKGRQSDGKIDILQNYGLAHHLCPDGDDSWCEYKREKESNKHKNGIPQCIVHEIEQVCDDLSNSDLLQKYTHRLTQNVNKCLSGLIWDRCSKTAYVEQSTVAQSTVAQSTVAILNYLTNWSEEHCT